MTLSESQHRAMWSWIAETGGTKREYFEAQDTPVRARPTSLCYACAEAMDRCQAADAGAAISYCEYCPVIWGADGVTTADGGLLCTSTGSPYDGFNGSPVSIFKDARKEAAWKILALEWRDEHVDK